MASLRGIKRDIDYLVGAVISDCYTCIILKDDSQEEVMDLVQDAVVLRNDLVYRANNPAEKHNKHLVKKHYSAIRSELFDRVDAIFARLSEICKK